MVAIRLPWRQKPKGDYLHEQPVTSAWQRQPKPSQLGRQNWLRIRPREFSGNEEPQYWILGLLPVGAFFWLIWYFQPQVLKSPPWILFLLVIALVIDFVSALVFRHRRV